MVEWKRLAILTRKEDWFNYGSTAVQKSSIQFIALYFTGKTAAV